MASHLSLALGNFACQDEGEQSRLFSLWKQSSSGRQRQKLERKLAPTCVGLHGLQEAERTVREAALCGDVMAQAGSHLVWGHVTFDPLPKTNPRPSQGSGLSQYFSGIFSDQSVLLLPMPFPRGSSPGVVRTGTFSCRSDTVPTLPEFTGVR